MRAERLSRSELRSLQYYTSVEVNGIKYLSLRQIIDVHHTVCTKYGIRYIPKNWRHVANAVRLHFRMVNKLMLSMSESGTTEDED